MKTEKLFKTSLSDAQKNNSKVNHIEFLEGKTLLESFPRRIVFELTNRCNFRCIMCGREATNFQTNDLPLSVIKRFDNCFPHIEEVTLHGWGEGTLHPEFINIIKYLNNYPLLRKYFVTNGSTLSKISQAIFDYHVDLVAVSLDGPTSEVNDSIRKGGNFHREINALKNLIDEKNKRNVNYPYINFVFTAMKRNVHMLPDMITLAHELNLPEVKVVYLTVFEESLLDETLFNLQDEVRAYFTEAVNRAIKFNINLKLPEIQGEGEAGNLRHKMCAFSWRDMYIGSDGFLRPCQSSSQKLVSVWESEDIMELWNSKQLKDMRNNVNIERLMPRQCYNCYHSTCANWNLRHSFIQLKQDFAPEWATKDSDVAKGI